MKRARKAKPKRAKGLKRALRQAVELFRKFREAEPKRVTTVQINVPPVAMLVGELDGVMYSTTHGRKAERYLHRFDKKSRPLLAASHDGKQLLVLGGRYNFTRDGIVDKPP